MLGEAYQAADMAAWEQDMVGPRITGWEKLLERMSLP